MDIIVGFRMVLSIGFGVFAQQNQKTHAVAKEKLCKEV
jgi:hypothetical protein